MVSRVAGAAGVRKLLRRLEPEAREEIADVIDDYGVKLLAAMKRDVPVATGALKSRLTKSKVGKSLALRVGFVGKRANGPISRKVTTKFNGKRRKIGDQFVGDQFYGRFVEFGRKAQTVRVTRRAKALRVLGNNRNGNTRRTVYGAGVYTMRVKAKAARPFVYKKRPELRNELRRDLSAKFEAIIGRLASGGAVAD